MSKAVLISIRPEWCEKIANGEKTIEIRKRRPKIETPFKCYIYCTKPSFPHEDFLVFDAEKNKVKAFYGGGKVIGEFVCNQLEPFTVGSLGSDEIQIKACLSYEELINYFYKQEELDGNTLKLGYGWHISNLNIYDDPKVLSDFHRPCPESLYCESCGMYTERGKKCGNAALQITRPPQSYKFVEELP